MTRSVESTRAEIYELARLLRMLGDPKGARQVTHALIFTEDAAALTALARLEVDHKEQN